LKFPDRLRRTVLFYDPRFLEHVSSPMHVERPERLHAIVDRLRQEDLFTDVRAPSPASAKELRRVHRTAFLEFFENLKEGFLDPETAVHPETWDIALRAAGATIQAAASPWSAERRRSPSYGHPGITPAPTTAAASAT